MRAYKNTVRCPDDCPFLDVPEVEFKKKTPILATLRDFSLPGLRRVFAGYWKFQVVLHAGSQCHSGPYTEKYSVILAVKWCKSSKTKAYSFYRRPPKHSKTALFFSFLFDSCNWALIAALCHIASTTRTAICYALCTTFTPSLWRSRSMTRTPPNLSAGLAVLVQLHFRDFSSSLAKNACQTHSLSIHFLRKQALVRESKK